MRKAQKEQAENFIKLLEQGHEEIKNNIRKGDWDMVLAMLADCQEGAIALGNLIETSEGENAATIPYLEGYCETVYQAYQSIANAESVDGDKIDKQLQRALDTVHDSVCNDIKIRKEIAFFPYKASMWDSLESVYLAAKAEADCDVYCVPIPYFDKAPDGTVKEMHYEGGEYPSNIEITDWESYHFEERRPDMIYIHNPYDGWNHVTSVHPRFYASNLAKYTDELVYIPYFVLNEIDPNDQPVIESMKHFCFLPGTIYADKVILQSENMRQIYINEYMKAAGLADNQKLRSDLEKKFLGLGSPKFDKVLHTKKEDLEIPEDWLKIIEKQDGSWKKIVLYNTGISALLQYDEKMLEKIKSVFEIFKENKDEVALLWRPHPLIRATIESMRPHLWTQYQEIVRQYREEGWGIYDQSADLDRAIVLGDAYYGDNSSVVTLCQKAGMLVMIQSAEIIENAIFSNAYFSGRTVAFDDKNDAMWLVTNETVTLLKIDINAGKVLSAYPIPIEQVKGYDFVEMAEIDQRLYFLPYNTEKFYCFSISEEEFSVIDIQLSDEEKNMPRKFKKMLFRENCVYLIGHNLDLIIKVNLLNKQVTRIEKLAGIGSTFAWDAVLVGDDLYIPLAEENIIIKLDTKDDSIKRIKIDSERSKGFVTITLKGQNLLLTDTMNNRIVYSLENGNTEISELKMMSNRLCKYDKCADYQNYQKVIVSQNKEYYFPVFEESVMIRNANGVYALLPFKHLCDLRSDSIYSKFELIESYRKCVYFQTRMSGDIFKIDLDTDEISMFHIWIESNCKKLNIRDVFRRKSKEIIYESNVFTVEEYIRYIKG